MPDHNLPLVKFTIHPFKGKITGQESDTMNEGSLDGVSSDDNLNGALHSKVPNILFLGFMSFEIFLVSIDYTCGSTVSAENERN